MSVKDGSYIVIPAFAVNELGLKGNELLMFSIVFGFSQDGESWFTGTRAYLAEWCGCSKVTVTKTLSSLCERGLLKKRVRVDSGVTLCDYAVVKKLDPQAKNLPTSVKNLNGGGKESCPPPVKKVNTNILEGYSKDTLRESEGAKRRRFTPPTPQEVADYAKEKGLSLDAERFCDHYTANGWKVGGRSPMKDWRAAVRNWCRNYSDWAKPLHAPEARKGTEYDGDF